MFSSVFLGLLFILVSKVEPPDSWNSVAIFMLVLSMLYVCGFAANFILLIYMGFT